MSHRLDLKVGYRCNNHCRFCVQGDKRSRIPDKSTAQIMAVLETRRPDNDEVVFTGGEVTLRKDFFALVRCARSLGYRSICIQTNGRMFAYEEFCKKAIESGANSFGLALHGSTSEIHDGLTRAPGSFEQTVQGIRNLVKLGQRPSTNTVITRYNYADLPALARLLCSLRLRQFQFAFIHINQLIKADPRLVSEIVPRKSVVEPYVKEGLQTGIDHGIRVMVEAIPYCCMSGYEEYLSDKYIPEASVQEEIFIEDFNRHRREKGKLKGPCCSACRYDAACEGPWREYPELFGWEEFKPVAKDERAGRKARVCVQQ
ncbi:MAG: radical SAM protein [Candidatus Omnitrophica bacterium]|nr:radical SAM protein [Candidatus Omnitrophota bacterium]